MSNGTLDFAALGMVPKGANQTKGLDAVHRFERAGLGKAPFRVVGFGQEKYQACPGAPIQPGTSCDYCGTGIMDVAYCMSSDGKRFKVGCDCVFKVNDSGLLKAIKQSPEYRKLQRDKRVALDARKKDEIEQLLQALEADREKFGMLPEDFRRRLGWCGMAGRARILKELRWQVSHE